MSEKNREKNGRFLPGYPGGPGRPKNSLHQDDWLRQKLDEVPKFVTRGGADNTIGHWELIFDRALRELEFGKPFNDALFRYIADRRLGKVAFQGDLKIEHDITYHIGKGYSECS